MSQSGLAEIAAVNRATQGAWERGDQTPSAEFLAKFAAVGVDVLYVVTGVRAQQPPVLEAHLTHEEISLLEDYRAASTESQSAARLVVASMAQAARLEAALRNSS